VTHGRVVLRRWRPADVATVDRIVSESLEHLLPWMPGAARHDRDEAAAFLERCEQQWAAGEAYNYAITVDGAEVGSCGMMRRIGPGGLEIGYWVHPAHTRQGIATAAAAALVEEAFTLPDVTHVEIHHDAANLASAAVPRKLGFVETFRAPREDGPAAPGETGVVVVWRITHP
jgi:RimJ/RimL family protein N-acetyltransferase